MKNCLKQPAAKQETIGDLSQLQREIVNYIFHKVNKTWGNALYQAHIGDELALQSSKRDWAMDMLQALKVKRTRGESEVDWADRARKEIDAVFSEIRRLQDGKGWEYPSLRKVCSYMASFRVRPEHREYRSAPLLVDQSAKERSVEAASDALSKIREVFGS